MANETEFSNIIGPTDVVSDAISHALVNAVVLQPLIYKEGVPQDTRVKLFRKEGSLAAETVTESSTYSFSASSELTQASVSATAGKSVVVSKVTVEAMRFREISPQRLLQLQGEAIARAQEAEIIALFTGATNSVTCTSILTADDVLTANWYVNSSKAGNMGGNNILAVDPKGALELQKELKNSAASSGGVGPFTTAYGTLETNSGYVMTLPGVDVFRVHGVPTSGSDDVNCVFNPNMAFGAMYDGMIQSEYVWVGSGGFFWEFASWTFHKCVEWNDEALAKILSDT